MDRRRFKKLKIYHAQLKRALTNRKSSAILAIAVLLLSYQNCAPANFSSVSSGLTSTASSGGNPSASPSPSANASPTPSGTPVPSNTPHPRINAGQLSVGSGGICVVSSTHEVFCWGQYGKYGSEKSVAPLMIPMPSGFTPLKVVATDDFSECVLGSSGLVYCWGGNDMGQLGANVTSFDSSTLLAVAMPAGVTFIDIEAGQSTVCGLTAGGQVYCWGNTTYFTGGDASSFSPAPVAVPLPSGVALKQIAVGWTNGCGLTSGGQAYCWGGDWGTTAVAITGPSGLSFSQVAVGNGISCGVTTLGAIYCWGTSGINEFGQSAGAMPTPNQLNTSGLSFQQITIGLTGTICGLATTGKVYCWGSNYENALGTSQCRSSTQTGDASVPTIIGISTAVTDLIGVYAGFGNACVLTASGVVFCWGDNTYGQLGTIYNQPGLEDITCVPQFIPQTDFDY